MADLNQPMSREDYLADLYERMEGFDQDELRDVWARGRSSARGRRRFMLGDAALVAWLDERGLRVARTTLMGWRLDCHPEWTEAERGAPPRPESPATIDGIVKASRVFCSQRLDLNDQSVYLDQLVCYTCLLIGHKIPEVADHIGFSPARVLLRHNEFPGDRASLIHVREVLDMAEMWHKGEVAWADVESATEWVEDLRGHSETKANFSEVENT